MPAARILHGDKGYDSNAIRRQVEDNGTMPNIPPKANRRWKNCFSPVLYRTSQDNAGPRSQLDYMLDAVISTGEDENRWRRCVSR